LVTPSEFREESLNISAREILNEFLNPKLLYSEDSSCNIVLKNDHVTFFFWKFEKMRSGKVGEFYDGEEVATLMV